MDGGDWISNGDVSNRFTHDGKAGLSLHKIICFGCVLESPQKYQFFSLFIILIPTPDFPHFYDILGGNLGSFLYGDVSVMACKVHSTIPVLPKSERLWTSSEAVKHDFL